MKLEELGLLMHNWHASQGDPVYMVGSYFVSGTDYPNLETVVDSRDILERLSQPPHSSSFKKRDIAELRTIVRGLNGYLKQREYVANASGPFPGICMCGSTNVTMTADYGVRGTGPGGRARLGDQSGDLTRSECKKCGRRWTYSSSGKVHAKALDPFTKSEVSVIQFPTIDEALDAARAMSKSVDAPVYVTRDRWVFPKATLMHPKREEVMQAEYVVRGDKKTRP